MPEKKLTEAAARKALPPVRGQSMLWDAEVKGFAPAGGRRAGPSPSSWTIDAEGRQRRITIGGLAGLDGGRRAARPPRT